MWAVVQIAHLHNERVNLSTGDRRVFMGKLKGKVAVITGATSGMALASAKLFAEE
jgi:hypothetical protein